MTWMETVKNWKNFEGLQEGLKEELNQLTETQLEDAFYKNLEFGTGGMRGEIGVGTNRMNIYTVRKASAGLATYIKEFGQEAMNKGVVIAYDSRHKSSEFAMEAAKTLATQGIQAYVFEELRPTPVLSFAVRHLNAYSGIVITASHNPPEYNGYKVYDADGGQLPLEAADAVIARVEAIENELTLEVADEQSLKEKGLIKMLGQEIDQAYLEKLVTISENPHLAEQTDLTVVFTPLHGTANKPVRAGLTALGYQNVHIVKEQELPDPEFSTVKSPNPEEHAAFELAIKLGQEVGADLLIATDPDADRLGIAVKNHQGEYEVLTGNQTGALLLHYLLINKKEKGTLKDNAAVLKTIVTSELGADIAASFGVPKIDVLTGFKFIAEKINEFDQTAEKSFLFGYEESYGYLIGDFARDKDAVQASVLATEVCAYYKQRGLSLYDALLAIFEQYGYYREGLRSLTLKGKAGAEVISKTLDSFRAEPIAELVGLKVTKQEDYLTSTRYEHGEEETIDLPASNVLKYFFEDGTWVCLRPSGTEPKIKFYFGVKGNGLEASKEKLASIESAFMEEVQTRMNAIQAE